MAKDPFRPAENNTQCPKCGDAFGWNKENGLAGQTCPCGYEFTGHERRKRKEAHMTSKRKFYVTKYVVTLLSEEPLKSAMSLEEVAYAMNEGECSGEVEAFPAKKVGAKKMAKLLQAQGSDPEFFHIDEEGNDTEV